MAKSLSPDLTLRMASSLSAVPAAAWDACANPPVDERNEGGEAGPARGTVPVLESVSEPLESVSQALESECEATESIDQEDTANPFISHAFLSALEESGSATKRTGWAGAHVLVEDSEGELLACAPAYLKSHSQGEYVFDHGWADAYARAGGALLPQAPGVACPSRPQPGGGCSCAPVRGRTTHARPS